MHITGLQQTRPSYIILSSAAAIAAAESLQSCPTAWPHRRQPTRLPRPWDSPGKSTGVGHHCLLHIIFYFSVLSSTFLFCRKINWGTENKFGRWWGSGSMILFYLPFVLKKNPQNSSYLNYLPYCIQNVKKKNSTAFQPLRSSGEHVWAVNTGSFLLFIFWNDRVLVSPVVTLLALSDFSYLFIRGN